jgi:iron complex outermembrane receptor protein
MASLTYGLDQSTNVYLSIGKGFDSPTLNQIKYSFSSGALQTTPNLGLMSSNTTQYEIGVKRRLGSKGIMSVAIFDAETVNEAVVDINSAGKTAFTNAPNTRRQGLEFFAQSNLINNFGASLSYTYLISKITEGYTTDAGSVVNSGNTLPGTSRNNLFADIYWRTPSQSIDYGLETVAASGMYANDTNSSMTSGYVIFNARVGFKQNYEGWTFSEFIRVNNFMDRYYVSSVIVNQAGSNYFEPAPGRNYVTGIRANYKF